MIKEYLVANGNNLLLCLQNFVSIEASKDICASLQCANVLANVIQDNSFEYITEEEAILLCKDFLDAVTYKDIDIMAKGPFYDKVYNACGMLWNFAPSKIRRAVYENL